MKSVLLAALALVFSFACAAAKPVEKMSAEEAFAPAPSTQFAPSQAKALIGAPKEWAKQFPRDLECEKGARGLEEAHGHEIAWTYVKACITRGGFTQLKTLCENWTEDLKTRPEAGSILAQVIASRGGHLKSDMEIVQQLRIPLFELSAAVKQSSAFKGRYLLVIGKIAEAKEAKGKTELVLMEQAIGSDLTSVITGPRSASVSTTSGGGSAGWKSSGIAGSGSASGNYQKTTRSESGRAEMRVTDFFEETGQVVIAKIKQPDPFLRVDKNLIFLVRFDGTAVADTENTDEGDEPHRTALVTLISYHDL